MYTKKHHISDMVFGFCHACRTGVWFSPMWDLWRYFAENTDVDCTRSYTVYRGKALRSFLCYAQDALVTSPATVRQVANAIDKLDIYLQGLTEEEVKYAIHLMHTYYLRTQP